MARPAPPVRVRGDPGVFWVVKLMDLGIVVPVALAVGIGLLRGAGWARRPMHVLLTACTGLGASVTAMAVVMLLNADPDASPALAAGFAVFTLVFAGLTAAGLRGLTAPTLDA